MDAPVIGGTCQHPGLGRSFTLPGGLNCKRFHDQSRSTLTAKRLNAAQAGPRMQ
uniref:Uncharacterized protein n=1 Tax=Anguilla anguilla TaxID=7936 RepID=A0A0E9QQA5_ANGAN